MASRNTKRRVKKRRSAPRTWEREVKRLATAMRSGVGDIIAMLKEDDHNVRPGKAIRSALGQLRAELDQTNLDHEDNILTHLNNTVTGVNDISILLTSVRFDQEVFFLVRSINTTVRNIFDRLLLNPQPPLPAPPSINPRDYPTTIELWAGDTRDIVDRIREHIESGRHGRRMGISGK